MSLGPCHLGVGAPAHRLDDSTKGTIVNDSTASTSVLAGRRAVLKGVAGLGAAGATLTFLSGCGGGGGQDAQGDLTAVTGAVQQAVASGQVPVGQAAALGDVGVVVTQPTEGNFVVFSDTCPHQGGKISGMSAEGTLFCPLHSAQFDPATGEPVAGPANQPLQKLDVPIA